MSHARIEEVSDSDPEIEDPVSFLPDSDKSIIAPVDLPFTASDNGQQHTAPTTRPPPSQNGEMLQPMGPSKFNAEQQRKQREAIKSFQILYPVYFDSSRTREEGRRVSKSLATPNPLARNILDAVQYALGGTPLKLAFEPDKLHPKDWANPGRVRIELVNPETKKSLHPRIKNKSHLYRLVAEYLQEHPTQEDDPKRLQIQGLPMPEKLEPPAIPRGWKVNSIVPLHSPAVGQGVSENFFKDMMKEMGDGKMPPGMEGMQQMLGGMGGMGGGSPARTESPVGKKDKKDKKKAKS